MTGARTARGTLIVDGCNVLHDDPWCRMAGDEGREALVAYLRGRSAGYEVVVVFDGHPSDPLGGARRRVGGLVVEYSLGRSADDVVLERVRGFGGQCRVVTRDRELEGRCVMLGAEVSGPESLWHERRTRGYTGRGAAQDEAGGARRKSGPSRRPKKDRGPKPWSL